MHPTLENLKIKQILTELKRETDNNTITIEDSNTSHSTTDRSSRQKINTETLDLNTLKQEHLTNTFGNSVQKQQKSILLKHTQNIFSVRSYFRSQNKC